MKQLSVNLSDCIVFKTKAIETIYSCFISLFNFNIIYFNSYYDTILKEFKQCCLKLIRFSVEMFNPLLVTKKT